MSKEQKVGFDYARVGERAYEDVEVLGFAEFIGKITKKFFGQIC